MPSSIHLLQTIAATFDLDIQIWTSRLLAELRRSESGFRFADWAREHPASFDALLRGLSVAARQVPRDRGLPLEIIRDHLVRLPFEIRRTILSEGDRSSAVFLDLLEDRQFFERYERALMSATAKEISLIAGLSTARIQEWVNSPAALRSAKLKQWDEELTPLKALTGFLKGFNDGLGLRDAQDYRFPEVPNSLTDAEAAVVRVLASEEKCTLSESKLKNRVPGKAVVSEVAIQSLKLKGVIQASFFGFSWSLTERGREFAVKHRML